MCSLLTWAEGDQAMPIRNINLTDHYDRFVENEIAVGRYKNAREVLRGSAAARATSKRRRNEVSRTARADCGGVCVPRPRSGCPPGRRAAACRLHRQNRARAARRVRRTPAAVVNDHWRITGYLRKRSRTSRRSSNGRMRSLERSAPSSPACWNGG